MVGEDGRAVSERYAGVQRQPAGLGLTRDLHDGDLPRCQRSHPLVQLISRTESQVRREAILEHLGGQVERASPHLWIARNVEVEDLMESIGLARWLPLLVGAVGGPTCGARPARSAW